MTESSDSGKKEPDRLSDEDLMALFAEDDSEDVPPVPVTATPVQPEPEEATPDETATGTGGSSDVDELSSFLDNFAEELAVESGAAAEQQEVSDESAEPFVLEDMVMPGTGAPAADEGPGAPEEEFTLDDLTFEDDEDAAAFPTLDDSAEAEVQAGPSRGRECSANGADRYDRRRSDGPGPHR